MHAHFRYSIRIIFYLLHSHGNTGHHQHHLIGCTTDILVHPSLQIRETALHGIDSYSPHSDLVGHEYKRRLLPGNRSNSSFISSNDLSTSESLSKKKFVLHKVTQSMTTTLPRTSHLLINFSSSRFVHCAPRSC